MDGLKCLFCGRDAKVQGSAVLECFRVSCVCGASGPKGRTPEKAVALYKPIGR